ncbi:MAG: hypothetical protein ACE37F_27550 [Nannocystaceae bacterium]
MTRRRSCAALAALGVVAGCGLFGSGRGVLSEPSTLDLSRWTVTRMDVDLVGSPTRLCPGERVQLSIVAELRHRERDKTRTAQTYEGNRPGIGRRGKLGFEHFSVRSPQGRIGEHGWYTPSPDPFVSVDGFTLEVAHTDDPSINETLDYKPRYDCARQAGGSGGAGTPGHAGSGGGSGDRGAFGGSSSDGGAGGDGASGGDGGAGTPGRPGGSITAWATVVRTPHHAHLVLLEFEGDASGRVMFDSHASFVLAATGGPGGRGGAGGQGGRGGDGGTGQQGGAGGSGGGGGTGGSGGAGGAGGDIVLTIDERFPELAQVIRIDVSGGHGGAGGPAGTGGLGGSGGRSSAEGASDGADGSVGADGASGANGPTGPSGTAQVVVGDVDPRFEELPEGISRL